MPAPGVANNWKYNERLLRKRWPWHLAFWVGYVLFRLWMYYVTVKYYHRIYLEYMLLAELLFVAMTYFTLWLYRRSFARSKYLVYFFAGTVGWTLYLYGRTAFQSYYLRNEPSFKSSRLADVLLSNITFVIVCFLFITACKYFKDGYIAQQFEAEKEKQQLMAEVNNLKSQIAPHFLFNTLNNLYGLAVGKSEKLPDLMLRLSDLLRHSLYETQKPLVAVTDEINILKSYTKLERVRLEDDLKLEFYNTVSGNSSLHIAPLILIVFVENAFKHAKFVQGEPVSIYINTRLENNLFNLTVRNNYNKATEGSANGIGLTNVKRRLEVLYPGPKHLLNVTKDDTFYTVSLQLQLEKAA